MRITRKGSGDWADRCLESRGEMDQHEGHQRTQGRPAAHSTTPARLHVCPACASELVQPLWWDENGDGSWSIGLRCPECEHSYEGVHLQHVLDDYDECLNDGTDLLLATYRRLVRENLAHEIDRFAGALAVGAILPEDF